MSMNRRDFLGAATGAALAAGMAGCQTLAAGKLWFEISLAQWSLHRSLQSGALHPLDFPARARELGFDAVEYVNVFYREDLGGAGDLAELRRRCDAEGVRSLLIMCDREGNLGDPDAAKRRQAVENHRRWLDAAQLLGCHSIRVNAASAGSFVEQQRLAADGLHHLCEMADPAGLNVLVENHGGWSSHGEWLAGVMRRVDHPRCGTLPDFGNFRVAKGYEYPRYRGIAELMPWARAVSAKSYAFDAAGNESTIDYVRAMQIVRAAGYRGHVGVEYEGKNLSEAGGIQATWRLLDNQRA